MCILKSSISGKSRIPITLDWLLANGWEYLKAKDPDTGKPYDDKTKICCCGHFLNVNKFKDFNGEEHTQITWTYRTDAALYKFPIKTFDDYEQIVKYYCEHRSKERGKIKKKILERPGVVIECNMWFSETPNKTIDEMKVTFKQVDQFFT